AGHGHPDLLHLTLYWDEPWCLDPGTGSYVSPSLHWYRSTLAHNAPGLAGVGQLSGAGHCSAFDVDDRWSWCQAVARDLVGEGTILTRTVIDGPDYIVDVVDVIAPDTQLVDLPIHTVGGIDVPHEIATESALLGRGGASGHEH